MTESQTESARAKATIPTVVVVAACALSGLVIVALVVLLILGKPINTLMIIVGSLVAPSIVGAFSVKKLSDLTPVVHDIAVKVNGRLDAALDYIRELEGTTNNAQTLARVPSPQHSAENPPADVPTPRTVQDLTSHG